MRSHVCSFPLVGGYSYQCKDKDAIIQVTFRSVDERVRFARVCAQLTALCARASVPVLPVPKAATKTDSSSDLNASVEELLASSENIVFTPRVDGEEENFDWRDL